MLPDHPPETVPNDNKYKPYGDDEPKRVENCIAVEQYRRPASSLTWGPTQG